MANTYQSDNELHAPTANEEEGDDAYYRPIRRLQQDNGRDDSTPYEPLKPRASSEVLLRRLHNVTDYDFDDQGLAWEALQADGSMIRWSGHRVFINGKTRLAVVGDRVAELVLSLDWYQWVEDDMQPGKGSFKLNSS